MYLFNILVKIKKSGERTVNEQNKVGKITLNRTTARNGCVEQTDKNIKKKNQKYTTSTGTQD